MRWIHNTIVFSNKLLRKVPMKPRVQRSLLILPVNVPRFVERAHLRGADAIVLDLEDAVPPAEKTQARRLVREAIKSSASGGADVFVRVNTGPEFLALDVEAAVCEQLHGIFMPKVESVVDVNRVEILISEHESRQGLQMGATKLSLHLESPRGILNVQELAQASTRVESLSLGVDDYCLELGVEPSEEGSELFFAMSMILTACRASHVSPIGIQGTVAGFRDPSGFERAAERSRSMGFTGGYCIHPDQVAILNRVFSPSPAKIHHAKRVIEAFEEAVKIGRASLSLDNRMVDTPIYKQAQLCIELSQAIEEKERQKTEALTGSSTNKG